ncbi:MAG: hypothetical protein JWN34_3366 [Bryobacterales bacterium]|nr:hypothetical protein [Bryobacterales bacterium]
MRCHLVVGLYLAAAFALSGCGTHANDPSRAPESVRSAQKLFKGQKKAAKTTRLPDSHDKQPKEVTTK